jgi:hypothetical protein
MYKSHDASFSERAAISQHTFALTFITWHVMRLEHNHTRGRCRGLFRITVPRTAFFRYIKKRVTVIPYRCLGVQPISSMLMGHP